MILDAFGAPINLTLENKFFYSQKLLQHGNMLLTSAEWGHLLPNWHGTIYSTEKVLNSYREHFKPDSTLLTFHALQPYEPEFICCDRCVVEITVLPAGQDLYSGSDIVVFLVKLTSSNINTLITKQLGHNVSFFPQNHPYHNRILEEGIDIVYIDVYGGRFAQIFYRPLWHDILSSLKPYTVKSLSGIPITEDLVNLCRKKQHCIV